MDSFLEDRGKRGINLGGRSRQENRASLLEQARKNRLARQQSKDQAAAATKIQSFFRFILQAKATKTSRIAIWEKEVDNLLANRVVITQELLFKTLYQYTFLWNPASHYQLLGKLGDLFTSYFTTNSTLPYDNQAWQTQLKRLSDIVLKVLTTPFAALHVDDHVRSAIIIILRCLSKAILCLPYFATNSRLVLAIVTSDNKEICEELCTILGKCVADERVADKDKQALSKSFIERVLVPEVVTQCSETFQEQILSLLPLLFELNSVPEHHVLPLINVLFKLALFHPSHLADVLVFITRVDIYNRIFTARKENSDSEESDDWFSDSEDEEDLRHSTNNNNISEKQQLLEHLSTFVHSEYFKQFSASCFTDIKIIHPHLITLSRLGTLVHQHGDKSKLLFPILNTLAFSLKVVASFWQVLVHNNQFDELASRDYIVGNADFASVFSFFCLVAAHWLLAIDDQEFFELQKEIKLTEWIYMIDILKALVITQLTLRRKALLHPSYDQLRDDTLFNSAVVLLRQLYERDCRRKITNESWVSEEVNEMLSGVSKSNVEVYASSEILRLVPFFIPLERRFEIFHHSVSNGPLYGRRSTTIEIKRSNLFEQGFDKIHAIEPQALKTYRLRIQFINAQGLPEAGIDGGGLFKEFMTEMLHTGFDPDRGLFKECPGSKELYPNPAARATVDDWEQLYFFMGRLLGMSLMEMVLVHLPLAKFFLSKILRKPANYINDLRFLDPQLYNNLMVLKNYAGDVEEDFNLTFSITKTSEDPTIIDLIPGGRDKPVNNANRMKYIFLVAAHRLNIQIKAQTSAFVSGFSQLIPYDSIQIFNETELQLLISGVQGAIDLQDLRKNTSYNYCKEDDPIIVHFWQVLEEFTPEQQRKFLLFVTSSERSPLLGFSYLDPKFCIQLGAEDENRLPTASTCFNLLKLPPYSSKEMLREKLLYSIESHSGFEYS